MSKRHVDYFAKKATEKRNAELKAAFEEKAEGIAFDVLDTASYRAAKVLNAGGFGDAVFAFAENWAKLMQLELWKVIVTGEIIDPTARKFAEVIENCAYDCYFQLGFMKLTENQFAFALGMLGEHWRFGKVLREWYKGFKAKAGVREVEVKDGEGK